MGVLPDINQKKSNTDMKEEKDDFTRNEINPTPSNIAMLPKIFSHKKAVEFTVEKELDPLDCEYFKKVVKNERKYMNKILLTLNAMHFQFHQVNSEEDDFWWEDQPTE